MSAEAMRIVEQIQAALTPENIIAGLEDSEAEQRIRLTFERLATPDFEVAMIGPEYVEPLETVGPDGFNELWRDWTSPFERFRIEVDELIDAGDQVVSMVRQIGVTKLGGVEVETAAAAVWTVVGGRLTRVE